MRVGLRVIGDAHGGYGRYLHLVSEADYSVQLGDLGFDYRCLEGLDPTHHKFIPGNHDNYDKLPLPHALMTFGAVSLGPYKFWYARGANSIDKQYRTEGLSWWANEQMSQAELEACVEDFEREQPLVVFTYDAPYQLYEELIGIGRNGFGPIRPNPTCLMLDECFRRWQPQLWLFGHHHRDYTTWKGHTHFKCLQELQTMDFDTYGYGNLGKERTKAVDESLDSIGEPEKCS